MVNNDSFNRPVLFSSSLYYVAKFRGGQIVFLTPNVGVDLRAKTLIQKEPETINWLDTMSEDDILWDIGANIGAFSLYAAKIKKVRVYAFEPYIPSLNLINENAVINDVDDLIRAYPIGVAEGSGLRDVRVSQFNTPGVAGHHVQYGAKDGLSTFKQAAVIMSMKHIIKLGIPQPTYIKIDVDGIEERIIMNGLEVIAGAKTILFELKHDQVKERENIFAALQDLGFEYETSSTQYRKNGGNPDRIDDNYVFTKPK